MKKIIKLLAFMLIAGLVIVACKDNFSEQDFINNQTKNKTVQDSLNATALNKAGQLLSYTLQVLDDKLPVAGVAVTMTNPPTGTATATLTGTTDASGFVQFKNVQIGANTFIISKTGYYSATFIVDFGTISNGVNYTIVNNVVIPVKKTASNQVPIFPSATGGSTATIKGNVTIETDLTNTTPEIPQGLVLKANLASVVGAGIGGNGGSTTNGQGTVNTYFFNTNAIGTATVDNTTGAYSMIVPAGADGRNLTMIYPVITANQKVGFNRLNGVITNSQISSTVPAVYGPSSLVGVYDNVPSVSGVIATYSPAPPAPGSGLKATYTVVPRALGTGSISAGSNIVNRGQIFYQLTNRGSGYNSFPGVTFSGGGASTQATATVQLSGIATGITFTNAGSGYTGTVTLTLQATDGTSNFNVTSFNQAVGAVATGLSSANVTLPTTGLGFTSSNPFLTGFLSSSFSFKWVVSGGGAGTGATATSTVSCSVEAVNIATGGTGYTSAPTIVIAAPGSGTTATLALLDFGTQWTIALDNSANTSPYKVLPNDVELTFNNIQSGNFTDNNITDQFGNFYGSIYDNLTISGGNVVFYDPTRTYRTNDFSQAQPTFIVTPSISIPAIARVDVDSNLGGALFGQVTNLSLTQSGQGYDVPPTVAIAAVTGATGSGAKADITQSINYDSFTKTYFVNSGGVITNPGSGYQPFLNMYGAYGAYGVGLGSTTAVQFSASTSVTVKTGDVAIVDVFYGTGLKKQKIN
jgi:hypothetical protein